MKRAILSILAVSMFIVSTVEAQTPIHLWSQNFGGTSGETAYSVAVDADGNVFITGTFIGTVDFGGGPLVSAGMFSDIFLVKFSPAGAHLWSRRFGDTNQDIGFSVATDASGNVWVTGYFNGSVDFGGGALVSAGLADIVLAEYDPSGNHLFSQRFGSTGSDLAYTVATDASGNVFLPAVFSGTVDFGGGPLVSAGSNDIALVKFSPTGIHLWSQRFGGTNADYAQSVSTDASGNVFLTGRFVFTADFGGVPLVSAGSSDIVLAKYDPAGTHLWSKRFGDNGLDDGRSVATDAPGNVFMAGAFSGTADFGGGPLMSAGGNDIVLAKYDPAGTNLWSQRFGSTDYDYGYSVATDAPGNVFLAGVFQGTVDFGGGPQVSAGGNDIVIAKYSASGVHRWSQGFGSVAFDYGYSAATIASGDAFMTGSFQGTADFGGGPLVSAGNADIVLARYVGNPPQPSITAITDIGNDQGGQVLIEFERSGHDDPATPIEITQYEAYRRIDAPPASSVVVGREMEELSKRQLLAEGWTQVGAVSAHGETGYSVVAPTIGDSTLASGQYYSAFFVRAASASPYTFFDSPPDSGYSLDNLAPGVPGSLLYNSGLLSWNESPAEDFDYFTVYGSNVDAFGSATVVDYTVSPGIDVTSAGYVFYFVTATDFSGNEGWPAEINTLSGTGGTPTSYVLSVSNYPNPFNPSTTVSYTVPERAPVTVAIYDARGARVATLIDNEEHDAGAYRMDWNGRADSELRVSSGVYFARIEQNGAVRTKKMVLLK